MPFADDQLKLRLPAAGYHQLFNVDANKQPLDAALEPFGDIHFSGSSPQKLTFLVGIRAVPHGAEPDPQSDIQH